MKCTLWHTNTVRTLALLSLIIFILNGCGGGGGGAPSPTPSPDPPPPGDDMDVVPPPPPGGPDLIIESTSVSDNTLTPGQQFTLRVMVRNRGDAQAAATTLRYKRDPSLPIISGNTTIGTDSVSSLSPSATSSESLSLTAPSNTGTYYYGACVDSVSGEIITSNNCSGNQGVRVTVSSSGGGSPGSGGSPGITFSVTDACNDGNSVSFRFFAVNNADEETGRWPGGNRVYNTLPYSQTSTSNLACDSETSKICYGGELESGGSTYYWGTGIDNDRGCSNCCTQCPSRGQGRRALRFGCPTR